MCHEDYRSLRCLLVSESLFEYYLPSASYICEPSFQTKIRNKCPRMVIKILTADAVAVSIRIVSPRKYAGIRDIIWEEIAEPMDVVRGRPSLVLMSVQSVNGNNTREIRTSSIDGGIAYSTIGLSPSTKTLRP
jgi:hypothetical protein